MTWKLIAPQLHLRRSLPRKPTQHSPYQDLLLSSKKIFKEVSAEVPSGYNGHTIQICVEPEYRYKSWIKVRCTKGAEKGVEWDLKDLPDALSKGFVRIPWHRLNVRIVIWAPKKKDSGQMICLYKKVRALVELLKRAKGFWSLRVLFGHTKTSWYGVLPQCSLTNKAHLLSWDGQLPGAQWDYNFILRLILCLRKARKARIVTRK